MKITPKIVAKLIYGCSQLRFWEREYAKDPGSELRQIMLKWQDRIDELLIELNATEFVGLKDLISEIELINHEQKV